MEDMNFAAVPVSDDRGRKRLDWVRSKVPTDEQRLDEQTRFCAEEALSFYYDEKGEDYNYKLDLPVNGTSHGIHRHCYDVVHVNFTAKKIDTDSPSKWFFAEVLYDPKHSDWEVVYCVTFDPDDQSDPEKISKSCTMCSGELEIPILHPQGQNLFGRYDELFYDCTTSDDDDSDDDSDDEE